jgi:Flp pilus assembly protein TadD
LGAAALASLVGLAVLPDQSWRVLQPAAGMADPRRLLQGMIVLLAGPTGWAAGIWMHRASGCASLAAVAAAGGAWLGVRAGADTGSWFLALAFVSVLPGAIRRGTGRHRLACAAVLAATIFLWLQSDFFPATALGEGRITWLGATSAPARGQIQVAEEQTAVSWGPGGTSLVRVSPSGLRLDLDGTRVQPGSRAVAADNLAPHLAGALVAHRGDALVQGDSLGHLASGLILQGFSRVEVVTRNVKGIRQQAALDADLSETLLHPAVHLERAAFEVRLQAPGSWDLVLEVARTPWLDAAGGLPDGAQLRRRQRALGDGGLYLLVATITRLDERRFRALIHDFGAAFDSTWALLPPNGADQVLLAGWQTRPAVSWSSFLAAYERGSVPLATLDIRSPLDLADRVLAGNELLMELAMDAGRRRPMGLGSRLHKRPTLLLPLLHDQVRGPAGLLADDTSEAVLELLAARAETQQTFLHLLSKTRSGDMKEVFENSRRLLEQTGGARALEPVIAPYLDAAREAIAQGMAEGPSSAAWTRAQGSLATAQLLHPRSPALLTLQGEILLAQGNLARAAESFSAAGRVESGRVDALHGLARVAMQRGNPRQAERYLATARERNPTEWSAAYNLGVFLSQQGRFVEAEEHLRRSSQLADKNLAAPHAALSQLYLGMGQPTRALVEASLAASRDPSALHHSLRGKAFYEVDQVDAAATAFQEAILLDPRHWQARAGLGLVYARRGEFGRCVQAFQGVLAADPGNPAATENLRRCEEARQAD